MQLKKALRPQNMKKDIIGKLKSWVETYVKLELISVFFWDDRRISLSDLF